MANQPPDPKTLQSWEDAFQHPLPVVRKLEQQLRRNIDDNRQKLRSLVGNSYRDLLGTAERIIEMDDQMRSAENHMADIGRKCNARTLERVAENHQRMKRERARGDEGKLRRIAQTKVLQSAIAVTRRVIKSGGDALVAAKVLTLARLLHKSLSEGTEPPAILEDLRKQLGQARKRLLAYIARALVRTSAEEKSCTAHTLSAYSLISTASPKEVLRYFLQVRFEQIETEGEVPAEADLVKMLDLYGQTLLDTKELFPRRFAESLSQLSKGALVRDPDIRSVHELSLDIYEQWISEDVRNFHPWVRHDQLSASEVGDAMASWTRQAQTTISQALKDSLKGQSIAQLVLERRHRVLSKFLSLSARLRSDQHNQAIHELRKVFIQRLEELAEEAATLSIFVPNVQSDSQTQTARIWDLATEKMDLSSGAITLRNTIIQRQHGRTSHTETITAALDDWLDRLRAFTEAISGMRSIKWDDDLDLDLDDLSDDDPLQTVLSKQEPQQLERTLHRAATASLQQAYNVTEQRFESVSDPVLFIRILREMDQRRRGLAEVIKDIDSVKPNRTFIATLHAKVATLVTDDPVKLYVKVLAYRAHTPITLWDGSPPLPIQPSPRSFKFLKSLHGAMSDAGNDLWSPQAVQVLRSHVADQLGERISIEAADGLTLSNGHAEAHDDADPAENLQGTNRDETIEDDAERNRFVQLLFDVLYLQRVLVAGKESRLDILAKKLQQRLELEGAANERLRKSANDYWKRTYLLFGLLAARHAS